jgi:hypothetical protein
MLTAPTHGSEHPIPADPYAHPVTLSRPDRSLLRASLRHEHDRLGQLVADCRRVGCEEAATALLKQAAEVMDIHDAIGE